MPLPAPPDSSKASLAPDRLCHRRNLFCPLIPKWWHRAEIRSITPFKGRCAGSQWRARRSLWAAGENDNARPSLKAYRAFQRKISGSFPIYAGLHHVGIFLKLPSPRTIQPRPLQRLPAPNRLAINSCEALSGRSANREFSRSIPP